MKIKHYWLFLSIFSLISPHSLACNLTITIDNILNDQGELLLGIYKVSPDSSHWPAEPDYNASFLTPQPGSLTHCLAVEAGLYSIRVLQDLNNNKQNDRNSSGIPTESFGFSYDGPKAIPLVSDTLFEVGQEPITKIITLKHPQPSKPTK